MIKSITKSKNAQSGHIEMILSFVIFAGFVLVIFVFLNPVTREKLSYTALDSVQSSIFKNLSLSYSSSSIILNSDVSGCFVVDDAIGLFSNLIVFDSKGDIKPVKVVSGSPGKIYVGSAVGRFFKLYYSNAFNTEVFSSSCSNVPPAGTYAFGTLNKESSILYENLADFNKSYIEDYSLLKSKLGLKSDFVYIVYTTDKTILYQDSISKRKVRSVNTLSRDIPLRAITKNAEFIDLIFHLEVW